MFRYIKILIAIFYFIILSSCYDKDIDDIEVTGKHTSTWGFPVGKTSFVLKDFIFDLDTSIKQYDDSLIYVLFQQHLITLNASEVVDIPDIEMPSVGTGSFGPLPFLIDEIVLPKYNLTHDFGLPADDYPYIDSIKLNSANLNISLNSSGLAPASISLTFNNILRDNNPLELNISLTEGNDDYNEVITLTSDDVIDFTQDQGNNIFSVGVGITAQKGSKTELNGNFSLGVSLKDIDYSSSYGYFGQYFNQTSPYNISMNVFELIPENAEFFREPSFKLFFNNSFGIPISFFFNVFEFESAKNSKTLNIQGSGVPTFASNSKIIKYPTLSEIGQVLVDSIDLNSENSNIDEAFHMSANQLTLSTSTTLNQNGYTNENFVSENDKLDLSFKLELPLAAKIKEFQLGDTIPFSFTDVSDDISMIEEVVLRFLVNNGFPTDGHVNANLLDQNYNSISSLIDAKLIESGKVEDGKVVETKESKPEISISKDEIGKLSDASYLSFVVTIKTTGEGEVWVDFYSNYTIKVNVGVKAKLTVNLDEN